MQERLDGGPGLDRKPWERLPDETNVAFEAAQTYFLMGPQRTIAKVAQKLNKSLFTCNEMSVKYAWVARSRAYDDYVAAVIRAESLQVQRDITREMALQLCAAIQVENKRAWFTPGGMMCRGCVKFSHGDPAKRCFASRPDNRGCYQVNARCDRLS